MRHLAVWEFDWSSAGCSGDCKLSSTSWTSCSDEFTDNAAGIEEEGVGCCCCPCTCSAIAHWEDPANVIMPACYDASRHTIGASAI